MADIPVELNHKLAPRLVSAGLSLIFALGTMAIAMKYLIPHLDPSRSEKERSKQRAAEVLKRLNINENKMELNEYELCIAQDLVDPATMQNTWSDIGGLEDVIQQLKETVIWPLRYSTAKSQRSSRICRPPKGVLLYGPPGCGKTLLARVTARESGAHFINLQASTLVDKWYGESQKRTTALFTLARKLAPCIIFIDEIDSFLRSRSRDDHEATAMMKTQFMTFWDGLQGGATDAGSGGIVIVGATNRLTDIDEAILRRMPARLYISPPNAAMRASILQVFLRDESFAQDTLSNLDELASRCDGFSGSDLLELCRQAAMIRLRLHYSKLEELRQSNSITKSDGYAGEQYYANDFVITHADFEEALRKVRATKNSMRNMQTSSQMRSNTNNLVDRFMQLLGNMQDSVANGYGQPVDESQAFELNRNPPSNETDPD